ncbi:MAG: transporter substrate-binding domain-containing protein, partial [Gammaproteobacteria bacterium]|nr:transporter substrate-binding domain-containing protein [Gammaproteobacteria bacterium]
MMINARNYWFVFIILSFFLSACEKSTSPAVSSTEPSPEQLNYIEKGDLPELLDRGFLRVIMPQSGMADDGLPRYGYPLHFEQEIIEDFAESIGLQLSWVIVEKRSDLMPYLYDGKGDIIAANLTITEKRKKQINFTVPVETVDEQLVVRSNEKITRKAQLSGRTIAVHRSSAFYDTAKQLQKKIKNLKIVIVPEQIPTERIIDGVASKEYDMTIADSNLVKATLRFRSDIKAAFSLSENNVVAWGVRPRSQLLLKQLNEFLSQEKLANSRELEYKVDLKGI